MKVPEIKSRLENIKGLSLYYGKIAFTLDSYKIDPDLERVYMSTVDGKSYDRPFNGIESFIVELQPAPVNGNGRQMAPVIEKQIVISPKEIVNQEINKDNMETTEIGIAKDAPTTITDLRALLMENISKLQTGKIDIGKAKEIANQAQTIINLVKLEIEYKKAKSQKLI